MSYRILVISDLHLREPTSDPRYSDFLNVLNSFEEDRSLHELILMGDVFDILIGPKPFWKKIHKEFFESLTRILSKNKKITWVQGNHDFQLTALLKPMGIHWIESSDVLERNGIRIYLSHGDLVDWRDKLHPLWRAFLTSKLMAFCIWLIPNSLAESIFYPFARYLSQASRRVSHQRSLDREEKARNIFRNYADKTATKTQSQIVLLGHSHISDDIQFPSGNRYINLGSWFQPTLPVGVLHLEQTRIDLKVFPTASWLSRLSQ